MAVGKNCTGFSHISQLTILLGWNETRFLEYSAYFNFLECGFVSATKIFSFNNIQPNFDFIRQKTAFLWEEHCPCTPIHHCQGVNGIILPGMIGTEPMGGWCAVPGCPIVDRQT